MEKNQGFWWPGLSRNQDIDTYSGRKTNKKKIQIWDPKFPQTSFFALTTRRDPCSVPWWRSRIQYRCMYITISIYIYVYQYLYEYINISIILVNILYWMINIVKIYIAACITPPSSFVEFRPWFEFGGQLLAGQRHAWQKKDCCCAGRATEFSCIHAFVHAWFSFTNSWNNYFHGWFSLH